MLHQLLVSNMSTFTKHVGKTPDNAKVVVVFRQLPDEPDQALVVYTQKLDAQLHDQFMPIVENQGQADMDFYKIATRSPFFDGRNLLESLHARGLLTKVPAANITMTPTAGHEINLADLNTQLNSMAPLKTSSGDITGEQTAPSMPTNSPGTLDDKTIADGMRRQALQFEMEAKRLRNEADGLDPNRQGRPRKAAKAVAEVAS